MYGYSSCLSAGWSDGVHDCRAFVGYQHAWVVIYREAGAAIGCHSRAEARRIYARLRAGVPAEALS